MTNQMIAFFVLYGLGIGVAVGCAIGSANDNAGPGAFVGALIALSLGAVFAMGALLA